MPDPALLKKIDVLLPKLFAKYDTDESGIVNDINMLTQITVNITYQLDLPMEAEDIDEAKQFCVYTGVEGRWSMAEFRNWYFNEFLPVYLTNAKARGSQPPSAGPSAIGLNRAIRGSK